MARMPGKFPLIIPDKTRNFGASVVLPVLIEQLHRFGVADSDILIIIAMGSHEPHQAGEIEKLVGKEIYHAYEIVEHDCRDVENLIFVGMTKAGTPVYLNRHVVEAGKRLVVGTAVHHYFAGYGGGPKMIQPGCAGHETIVRNHALSIDQRSGCIHPNCQAGVVAGNPVQADILDSLQFLQVDLLLETVLDENGKIIFASCGDLFETHARACQLVDDLYRIPIKGRADLVVASCGGYPKDINFIQAHKTLNNAFYAVKERGVILLLAECRDGIGSKTFLRWFQFENESDFLSALKQNYTLNGTTALSVKTKTSKCRVILISKLPSDLVLQLGLTPARTLDEGLKLALSSLSHDFTCIVMPNASLTLPEVKNAVN